VKQFKKASVSSESQREEAANVQAFQEFKNG